MGQTAREQCSTGPDALGIFVALFGGVVLGVRAFRCTHLKSYIDVSTAYQAIAVIDDKGVEAILDAIDDSEAETLTHELIS